MHSSQMFELIELYPRSTTPLETLAEAMLLGSGRTLRAGLIMSPAPAPTCPNRATGIISAVPTATLRQRPLYIKEPSIKDVNKFM